MVSRSHSTPENGGSVCVFLCPCGGTVSPLLDFNALVSGALSLPGVGAVFFLDLLCSAGAMAEAARLISEGGFKAAVFAGCSPGEHESAFASILLEAGLDPHLLQVANIREQCAWVTADRELATAKAASLIAAAVARVRLHEPLRALSTVALGEVLVVGAGPAGLSAALALAEAGRKVFLVESSLALGGPAYRLPRLQPGMECGSCVLAPLCGEVLRHERIEILTGARVTGVVGRPGRFQAKIETTPRGVDPKLCIGCLSCGAACPVTAGEGEPKAIGTPFPGALPNVSAIDWDQCLRSSGSDCTLCRDACPSGAVSYVREPALRTVEAGSVIVATGSGGAGALGEMLDLPVDGNGCFSSGETVFSTSSAKRGVYVCGAAAGSRLVREASESGLAAAARILAFMRPGEPVELEAATARVDAGRCGSCGVCVAACPYGALLLAENSAGVEERLCRGCGLCVSACPAAALDLAHSTLAQLEAETACLCGGSG